MLRLNLKRGLLVLLALTIVAAVVVWIVRRSQRRWPDKARLVWVVQAASTFNEEDHE